MICDIGFNVPGAKECEVWREKKAEKAEKAEEEKEEREAVACECSKE